MTRHELIDGKWYLVRKEFEEDGFLVHKMIAYCDTTMCLGGEDFQFFIDNNYEWVEIDPELVFEMFKEGRPFMIKNYSSFALTTDMPSRGQVDGNKI